MKITRTLLLFLCIFLNQILYSQNMPLVYVGFDSAIEFSIDENVKTTLVRSDKQYNSIFEKFEFQLEKALLFTEPHFQYLARQATHLIGNDQSVQNLRNIFILKSTLYEAALQNLALELEKIESVRYVNFMPSTPIEPPYDIPPTTPNFVSNQTYINANPGVNMSYAWNLGINGQSIRVRDVEYGFNKNHEEFNDINVSLAPGMTVHPDASTAYTEHGSATLGVLFAQNGDFGVTGLAHGLSEVILFPEWTSEYGYNRVFGVNQAIGASLTGDVIMYEMQAYGATGSGSDFVPAEYNSVIWDLTKAATDAGIVIVAAAGNGNQNLDGSLYATYLARGNSGAILVGSGTADVNHNRVGSSTYGSRIDVQGWGNTVYTSGYTTLASLGNDFNQTYSYFSGTSSATAVVTGCVAVLQSYYYNQTGSYLTGNQINQILKATGIPQGNSVSGQIGPLPDMENAILYINSLSDPNFNNQDKWALFPNPVDDQLFIRFENSFENLIPVEIYNTMGQIVLIDTISSYNPLSVNELEKGVYILKIYYNNQTYHKKFIKKQ